MRLAGTSGNHFAQHPSSGRATCITSILNIMVTADKAACSFHISSDVAFPYLWLWGPAQHLSVLAPLSVGSESFHQCSPETSWIAYTMLFCSSSSYLGNFSCMRTRAYDCDAPSSRLLKSSSSCSSWRQPTMDIHYNVPCIVCSRQLAKHLSGWPDSLSDYIKCGPFLCSMLAVFLRVNLTPVFYHAVVAFRQVTGRQKALWTWGSNHDIWICLFLLF